MARASTSKPPRVSAAELSVWVVGVAFGGLLAVLAGTAQEWTAAVMAVAVLAVAGYYVRVLGLQVGLIVLLIVTSTVDRFTFRAGSFDLRAEEVAGLVALAALFVTRARAGDSSWIRVSPAEGLLALWFAVNIASSLMGSPDRRLSAKIIALVAVCSLGLVLPRRLLTGDKSAQQLETVVRWLLVAFATESAYGTAAYLLHVFGPTLAISPNPASGHFGAYGTLWEPNVFGAFAAAGGVAWVYLGPGRFGKAWLGFAACVGGLLDSITRFAWLVAAAVAALAVAAPDLRRRLDWASLWRGALASALVVAATLAVDRLGVYTVALAGSGRRSGSLLTALLNLVDIVGRFNQLGPIRDDIHGHLLLGRGTHSYEALNVVNGVPQHIASLPLLVLNDTGAVGLVVFLGFLAVVAARAWTFRKSAVAAALGQVALVVLLTNLATETTELMIGWLLIGILLAATDVASAARSESLETPPKPTQRQEGDRVVNM